MNSKTSQLGFTLVEVLVSLALFTVIVLAAIGSLYTVNQASVKVNAMRTVLDNLNFATESMSRTIRTGQNIVCGGVGNGSNTHSCPLGDNGRHDVISLDSTIDGTTIQYMFGSNRSTHVGEIDKCTLVNGQLTAGACVAITAPEVNVKKMDFYVDGADTGDGKQPSVMMVIQGIANAGQDNVAPFALQTEVSQRAAE